MYYLAITYNLLFLFSRILPEKKKLNVPTSIFAKSKVVLLFKKDFSSYTT